MQFLEWTWQWRQDDCDGVSNHRRLDRLLNRLLRRKSKKHQNSASLAIVRRIHRWPVNSPHKGPVTRKIFPFGDVIIEFVYSKITEVCFCGSKWQYVSIGWEMTAWHRTGDKPLSDPKLTRSVTPYNVTRAQRVNPLPAEFWELIKWHFPRWRHEMETFSALPAICVGNSLVPGEFPAQRPVTRSFNVFFDLRLNKPLSKQSWGWWYETLSRSLWRHCN